MMTANSDWLTHRRRSSSKGKNDSARGTRNLQLQVPRPWWCSSAAGARSASGRGLGSLVRVRADHRGELGLDQRLVDRFGGLPDPVINLGGFEYFQDFE